MPFPISESEIRQSEAELGARLPLAFRNYLAGCNGGDLPIGEDDWQIVPLLDRSDRKRISRTANHIVRETAEARKWPKFPPDAVVVAHNGGGDWLVMLDLGGALSNDIYFWAHETGRLSKLAGSFTDLLALSSKP